MPTTRVLPTRRDGAVPEKVPGTMAGPRSEPRACPWCSGSPSRRSVVERGGRHQELDGPGVREVHHRHDFPGVPGIELLRRIAERQHIV